ncbi:carboxypeptidase regulatory-like domain-containing protein [Acidobacteria bacterium AH-259-G07]|nr:carboxypeptidase regulatory-like domain-containing protein [Acidobacteria bacterium AH-259-G07]
MQSNNSTKGSLRLALTVCALLLVCAPSLTGADLEVGALVGKIQLSSGAKNENTVVYLEGVTGGYQGRKQPAMIGQKDKVFIPHLLPLQKSQSVKFANSDLFSHNVHVYWGRRSLFNVVQGIEGEHGWTPPRPGVYLVLCDIHREMSAFVFVFDHPFFSTVDHQGSTGASQFKIEGVPEGTYTLVAVRDMKRRLERQKQEVTIKAGQTTTVTFRF